MLAKQMNFDIDTAAVQLAFELSEGEQHQEGSNIEYQKIMIIEGSKKVKSYQTSTN